MQDPEDSKLSEQGEPTELSKTEIVITFLLMVLVFLLLANWLLTR